MYVMIVQSPYVLSHDIGSMNLAWEIKEQDEEEGGGG